jgi:hypothetical protein
MRGVTSTFESSGGDATIAYVRGRNNGNRNAVRCAILQLSDAGEDGAYRSRNILPRVGRADGDVVPRVRASFGARPAQDVRKDAFIEINEVVQTDLGRQVE